MTEVALIAAVAENGVIGKNNTLPWHIPEDFQFFKEKTLNSSVIMGRKTFESLGSPLPKRHNIVVSRTLEKETGVEVCKNLDEALESAKKTHRTLFIIGGVSLYQEGMDIADTLYITKVHKSFDGDTFFPEIPSFFEEVESKRVSTESGVDVSFCIFKRK